MTKFLPYSGLFFLIFLLGSCNSENRPPGTYSNPVIPGEIPDPTIIRVGETYYAAGTSFDFGPNYPIYQSDDLVNWERIASVFSEPPAWSSDDFWAPELFYKDGTYFVYYTTKRKDNRIACIGLATTDDIHKGFTDHGIIIEWGEEAIDAFVFQDEDEKLYITWKAYGLTEGRDVEILASELSSDGLELVGEHFTLTDHNQGWDGLGDEGQCLVKRDGYYYLFYSIGGCCDNKCDYRVRVARSKDLRSGWEQYPDPILQGGEEWLCTGHGTLVTTPDSRWYYLYHAYNATDFEFIGRQGLLDELFWDNQTGWPYFMNGTPSETAETPFPNTEQIIEAEWQDDFSTDQNLVYLEWDINYSKPLIEIVKGEIAITSRHEGANFLGLRPKKGDYILSAEAISSEGLSGIGVYSNEQNYLALMIDQSELFLIQVKNGERVTLSKQRIGEMGSVFLKYEAQAGRYFQFFWSENGQDWIPVDKEGDYTLDGTFVAQWGYSPRGGFVMEGKESSTHRYSEIRIAYQAIESSEYSGNPIFPGWYADPEGIIFDDEYWIYPTYSDDYGEPDRSTEFTEKQLEVQKNTINPQYLKQTFFNAFSSKDLVNWKKHSHVLDIKDVAWASYSVWAPSIIRANNKYYLFFGANDIQSDEEYGGIGVAVSDSPAGPFVDALGSPLIQTFHNGAQPIDQFIFKDDDGQYYMYYGGWSHCNVVRLSKDLLSLEPFEDGETFKEITPENYVEGPFVINRKGIYYMMWSEGGWGGPNYSVAYAKSDSPLGPFKRIGKILQQDSTIATGAGHHSVLHIPDTDDYYIVYHRRPLNTDNGNHRETCIDIMTFDDEGFINPVIMTTEGVKKRILYY